MNLSESAKNRGMRRERIVQKSRMPRLGGIGGRSSTAERRPVEPKMRVRLPSPTPKGKKDENNISVDYYRRRQLHRRC